MSSPLQALDATIDVVVQYDRELRYTYVNDAAARLLGRKREEVIGRNNTELIGLEGARSIEPYVRLAFEGAKPVTIDHHIPLPDRVLIFETIYSPVPDAQGVATSVLGICRDVTEVRKSQELDRATLMSSAKLASMGEMAAGMAHEINNPLLVLKLQVGMIRKVMSMESLRRDILDRTSDELEATVDRIAKIVHGLRAFSRDGSQDPLKPHPLGPILDDTLALSSDRLKMLRIELDLAEFDRDCRVSCRPTEIAQILLNLISNAKDAVSRSETRRIRVFTRAREGWVRISVEDSGPGVPAELREKIFAPFYTTKKSEGGTGLGLSISKRIADAHGGALELDESEGTTRFVLKLPAV